MSYMYVYMYMYIYMYVNIYIYMYVFKYKGRRALHSTHRPSIFVSDLEDSPGIGASGAGKPSEKTGQKKMMKEP